LVMKILYFLAALIGGFLPISGYYMWWKRTRTIKKKA
ncbi:MAG: PepSY domain-containing protein, partial [Prevotella sp.]|nr:PepSY domain-containing protein [Prevotella sp.]